MNQEFQFMMNFQEILRTVFIQKQLCFFNFDLTLMITFYTFCKMCARMTIIEENFILKKPFICKRNIV